VGLFIPYPTAGIGSAPPLFEKLRRKNKRKRNKERKTPLRSQS
jgi:hypothetical protein